MSHTTTQLSFTFAPTATRAMAASVAPAPPPTLPKKMRPEHATHNAPAFHRAQRETAWTSAVDALNKLNTPGADLLAQVRLAIIHGEKAAARDADWSALMRKWTAALARERRAFADLSCDLASVGVSTRLQDRGQGRPVGVHYNAHTGEVSAAAARRSGGRPLVYGVVQRMPGGGYVGKVNLTLTGTVLGSVLERVRQHAELGG